MAWTQEQHDRVKRNIAKIRSMHNGMVSSVEGDLLDAVTEIERLQSKLESWRWEAHQDLMRREEEESQ